MLFKNYKFEVVEIRKSGATITHYLNGRKKDVEKDIETFKKNSKAYQTVGKDGLIVWM